MAGNSKDEELRPHIHEQGCWDSERTAGGSVDLSVMLPWRGRDVRDALTYYMSDDRKKRQKQITFR